MLSELQVNFEHPAWKSFPSAASRYFPLLRKLSGHGPITQICCDSCMHFSKRLELSLANLENSSKPIIQAMASIYVSEARNTFVYLRKILERMPEIQLRHLQRRINK